MGPREYGPRLLATRESGFHDQMTCHPVGSALTTATRRAMEGPRLLAAADSIPRLCNAWRQAPRRNLQQWRTDRTGDASKDPGGKTAAMRANLHHPQGGPKDDAATTRKGRHGDGRDDLGD